MPTLFDATKVGEIQLKNRIVMAPMTRSRASVDGIQGDLPPTYYRQRSGAGLIVSEATAVSKQGSGYVNIPGIWNEKQVKGWQGVTRAVHDAGGKIFLQMFHTGRVGHSSLYGEQPVAPTTKPPEGKVMGADYAMHDYETPRMLRLDEIPGIIEQFKTGAENAKKAGFDGVEIHAANGYIIDQFLRDGVNERTDEYGGSVENRARLLQEVVAVTVEIWGPGKVGVRLSPVNTFNSMSDSNPLETFTYVGKMLSEFPLAYIHLIEANTSDKANITPGDYAVSRSMRKVFSGPLILNGGLNKETGQRLIDENIADLIAFGVPFISNPDLVERFRDNLPLSPADNATFYSGSDKGYIDYPLANKKAA